MGKNYWISPQLLEHVDRGECLPVIVKDQVFALGGTVLSLAMMTEVPF